MRSVKRRRVSSYQRVPSSTSKKSGYSFLGIQSRYEDDNIEKFSSESEDELQNQSSPKRQNVVTVVPQTQAVSKIHWSSDESDQKESYGKKNEFRKKRSKAMEKRTYFCLKNIVIISGISYHNTTGVDIEDFNGTILTKSNHDQTIHDCNTDDEVTISQATSDESQAKVPNSIQDENANDFHSLCMSFSRENSEEISFEATASPPIVNISLHQTISNYQRTDHEVENIDSDDECCHGNSEKRVKRVQKGGLLERLKKLVLREKSDAAFWKHGLKARNTDESTIYLNVEKISSLFSTTALQCSLPPNGMNVSLILPEDQCKDIQSLCVIQLHPPWKRMFNKDLNSVVLLCGYHFILTEEIAKSTKAGQELLEYYQQQITSKKQETNETCLLETTVVEPQASSTNKESCLSILQSVELHSNLGRLNFTAIIQRKCCKLQKKDTSVQSFTDRMQSVETDKIFSFIVQDNVGMLGEIILSAAQKNWNDDCVDGKVYDFSKLRLLKRRSHSKSHSFRSMIQQFLPEKARLIEISSQLEDSGSQENVYNIPYSSYVFLADQSSVFIENQSEKGFVYHEPCMNGSIENMERVSLHATIIAISKIDPNSLLENSIQSDLIIYAVVWRNETLMIKQFKKSWKCPLPEELLSKLNGTCIEEYLHIYFKDIRNVGGNYVLDEYSNVFLEPPIESFNMDAINLPFLSVNSTSGDFVFVSGIICGIEEETALLWNVCEVCDTSIESSPINNSAFCEYCKKDCKVGQKFQLSVYVYVDSFSSSSILIKLLETTIRRFVEGASTEIHQGFRIESILQKEIGPLPCEILHVEMSPDHHKQFILQELRHCIKLS